MGRGLWVIVESETAIQLMTDTGGFYFNLGDSDAGRRRPTSEAGGSRFQRPGCYGEEKTYAEAYRTG